MKDFKLVAQRNRLVESIRRKGISDERVLAAIHAVPRHLFVPGQHRARSYEDTALPLSEGQTISQPYTVAFQTELLSVSPGMKVLEIGTGSGYQAAVLRQMGVELYTLERIASLRGFVENAELASWFEGVHFLHGDGFAGYPQAAPFDRILVTAAAAELPQALVDQLKPGGLLVLPVGPEGSTQRMMRIQKNLDGGWSEEDFGAFQFVPMLPGTY